MKTIAVYNIKGGVGKTATSVNLSYLAGQEGFRTLLIDLDPQGAAGYYFRVVSPDKHHAKKVVSARTKKIMKNIRGSDYENLHLLPADFSYRHLDLRLDNQKNSKNRLKILFNGFKKYYDLIFIDCPPNITLVSENVFRAADIILVPVIPTTLSLRTLQQISEFINRDRYRSGRLLPFFSMVEARKIMHREMVTTMRNNFPGFLQQTIPYTAEIEKMGLYREPVAAHQPRGRAGRAFKFLWDEIKSQSGLAEAGKKGIAG